MGTQGWRDMSTAERRANVAKQARDSNGRWIEMGKPVKYYSKSAGGMKSGLIVGVSGGSAYIIPPLSNATQAPMPHKVPLSAVQMIGAKGRLPRTANLAAAFAEVKKNVEAMAKKRSEELSKAAKAKADERTKKLREEAKEAGEKRSKELKEKARKEADARSARLRKEAQDRAEARNLQREKEREARQDKRTREREARQDQRTKEREARQAQREKEREARQDARQAQREKEQAAKQAQREKEREAKQAQREKEQAAKQAQREKEREAERAKREQERKSSSSGSKSGYKPSNKDIQKYVSDGISNMMKSMSDSERQEFRDFLNTIRDLISKNPTPDPTKKYSSNDHSKSPERPTVRDAVSDFFNAISEYFDGKRSDFKDIKYTTLKDTDKHDLKSSVRLGENGPEVVLRDQDGKLITTVPVARDDDPDRVTDLLMDHYDYDESE